MCNSNKPISQIIRQRLVDAGVEFKANDNISAWLKDGEMELLQKEVEGKFHEVLQSLVIDTDNCWNSNETGKRVAKMFLREIFSGRFEPEPKITAFPNATKYDGLYVTGPITIRSTCAHHMMPIVGKAYVGVFPGEKVIGLSKFNRLADWISSRPQIQEELTTHIAEKIMKETEAQGVAVLIRAEHFCMTHRGVREHDSDMTTSVLLGKLRTEQSLKNEFLQIVASMK